MQLAEPLPGCETLSIRPRKTSPVIDMATGNLVPMPVEPLPLPETGNVSIVSIEQVRAMRAAMNASLAAEAGLTDLPEEPTPAPAEAPVVAAPSRNGQHAHPSSDKPPAEPVPVDPSALCPRCSTRLISPDSLGLCPDCGYCRSLEEGKSQAAEEPEKPRLSLFGLVEFLQLFGYVPAAIWLVLAGVGFGVALTVFGTRLSPANSDGRAWWGGLQFTVGVLTLAAAHIWGLLRVAPADERVGPVDLLALSLRVWHLVFQRLPATAWPLVLGCWGATLTIAALLLYGLPFSGLGRAEEGYLARELRQLLASTRQSEYRAVQSSAASDVATRPAPRLVSSSSKDDDRPTVQAVVIGYRSTPDGSPAEVIVATPENGELRYSGVVPVSADQSRDLRERFNQLERDAAPSGSATPGTVWVKPGAGIEVHHSGTDGKGNLKDPTFRRLLNAGSRE